LLVLPFAEKGLPVAVLGPQLPFQYHPSACWAFACKQRGSTLLKGRQLAGW